MAFVLQEGIVTLIRAYLSDNFDAKLAAINAEYDDDIDLRDVVTLNGEKAWFSSERRLDAIQGYPVGFVLAGETKILQWNNSFVDQDSEVTVAVLISEQDVLKIRRMMYRYARALWECLVDSHYAGAGYHILGTPVLDVSPVLTPKGTMALGEARVVVRVNKRDTR